MSKQLIKGNEALAKSAILAGCRAFYGYPITPASEITEAAALYMPRVGGVFLQAESEVAAINMLYGASSAGIRCMTASSGPGISLMQEGISYMAGAELPCVVADITRGGPGLGNIAAEQSDYHQVVKGGGNGNYRTLVVAPYSALVASVGIAIAAASTTSIQDSGVAPKTTTHLTYQVRACVSSDESACSVWSNSAVETVLTGCPPGGCQAPPPAPVK